MIRIKFNPEYAEFEFHLSNIESQFLFDHIVFILKENNIFYNKEIRLSSSSNYINVLNCVEELQLNYPEETKISNEDFILLKDLLYYGSTEIKTVRPKLNKPLLEKFPPLKGKHPNERYQYKTLVNCLSSNRHIMKLDMGLGKTFVAAMVLGHYIPQNKIDACIIVCRPEGMEKTRFELLNFLQDYIEEEDIVCVYTDHKDIEDYFDKKIIITNYTTFRVIGQYYHKKVTKRDTKKPKKKTIPFNKFGSDGKRIIFLDEAQNIKTHKSQQSHILSLYASYFEYRYLMSGSIGYKIEEYFSYLKFLAPDIVTGNYQTFLSLIANMGNNFSQYQIGSYKEDRIKEFKEKVIDRIQTSYTSEECLAIPPNIENKIYIKMTNKMRKIYHSFINHAISEDGDIIDMDGRQLLSQFGYYQLATSDPLMLKDRFDCPELKFWKFTDNPKWNILLSLLSKYIKDEGRKVCIRANNPDVLEKIAHHLNSLDKNKKNKVYSPVVIHGRTKSKIRGLNTEKYCRHLLDSFKDPCNNHNVILMSNKKYYSSINLYEVTRTIYWDRDSNPEYFDQSKKRSNRIGTKEATQYDELIMNETIDVYIDEQILTPKKETQNILTTKKQLSIEDFKKVFNARKEDYIFKTGKRKRSRKKEIFII